MVAPGLTITFRDSAVSRSGAGHAALPEHDGTEAIRFLESVRPGGPWSVSVIYPDANGERIDGDARMETRTFTISKKAKRWIAARIGEGNLYFALNPTLSINKKATKADIPAVEFIHVDIDEVDGQHLSRNPTLKAEVYRRLMACSQPGPPTAVVDSGGGLQAIWRLDEPLGPEKFDLAESYNRHMIQQFGGDIGTQNVDRILRLPGTVNLPDDKKRAAGRKQASAHLLHSSHAAYDPLLDFDSAPLVESVEVKLEFGEPIEVDDLASLSSTYDFPRELVSIIEDGRLASPKERDDSRSAWVFDAACRMIRQCVPDELILGVLTDERFGISESVREHPRGDVAQAERVLRAAHNAIASDNLEFEDDEHNDKPDSSKAARFKRFTISELCALPPARWVVGSFIPENGLVQIYGERKKGKTFVVLAMALCVATGRPFYGHEVARGRVTYVISEGGAARFAERVLAWCQHNKVDPDDLEGWFDVVPVRVGVDNDKDLKSFIETDASSRTLVIFDTLARSMDGDENATKDMNLAIKGFDRVRERYHCAVIVVHHAGKDRTKLARGSTVLPGAVDATLFVDRLASGIVTLTLQEARNLEAGVQLRFEPRQVVIDGDIERGSMVLQLVEAVAPQAPDDTGDKILVKIAGAGSISRASDLVDDKTPGLSKANVNKILRKLRDEGLIEGSGPMRVTPAGLDLAQRFGDFAAEEEEDDDPL